MPDLAAAPAPGATVVDALALLTAVADDLVVGTVRDTHDAISRRVHGLLGTGLGPAGAPVETIHRGIAGAIYGGLGIALRGSSAGLDRLAATGVGPRLEDDRRGRFVSAAVNGLIGDELLRDRPQLAIPMAVRVDGRDVAPSRAELDAAFPSATGKVVVFLHGLCENESYWGFFRERTGTTYGEALAASDWTPVYLRTNTGLPIRYNGVMLAGLLRDLVAEWPVDVDRIALVGHSMGGLVMRAASAVLAEGDAPAAWTRRVSDIVTLGAPHLGSPLAVLAGHGSRAFGRLPETRAFGQRILDRRSEGIMDLVDGLTGADVPPLDHARYRFVSATLTRSDRHPFGRLVGDLLVQPGSARGRDWRGAQVCPGATTLHVGRTDHFGLLNHPDVLTALEEWLA